MKYKFYLYFLCPFVSINVFGQEPLQGAHAHNDYKHERPLLDALSYGFTSIEVDILLVNGQLLVGHDYPEKEQTLPTLSELYLQPLDSIFIKNRGMLYPGHDIASFLMIDIKTDGEKTYLLLNEQLQKYQKWIHQYENEGRQGKLTVFISGNRPMQTVMQDNHRLVSLDGRPVDLGKGFDKEMMPVISQNYGLYSTWIGEGQMPKADQEKIRLLANNVHLEDKKLRLWGYPDNIDIWTTLRTLGVDIINADDLEMLRDFLSKQ